MIKILSKPGMKGGNQHLLSHRFWGQESECGLTDCLWLKVSHEVMVKLSAGAQSPLKMQVSENALPRSLTWLSVGFSSSWAVRLRTSVLQ